MGLKEDVKDIISSRELYIRSLAKRWTWPIGVEFLNSTVEFTIENSSNKENTLETFQEGLKVKIKKQKEKIKAHRPHKSHGREKINGPKSDKDLEKSLSAMKKKLEVWEFQMKMIEEGNEDFIQKAVKSIEEENESRKEQDYIRFSARELAETTKKALSICNFIIGEALRRCFKDEIAVFDMDYDILLRACQGYVQKAIARLKPEYSEIRMVDEFALEIMLYRCVEIAKECSRFFIDEKNESEYIFSHLRLLDDDSKLRVLGKFCDEYPDLYKHLNKKQSK